MRAAHERCISKPTFTEENIVRAFFCVVVTIGWAGCAARPHTEHVAPAPAAHAGDGESVGSGGEATSGDHQPQIVRAGKTFKLSFLEAQTRYSKGARCAGDDAPENTVGQPDQRNEMQVGKSRVVTYGFRFAEGTLMIRCRADHVEMVRLLK
jgi:hypothetical protein